MKWTGKNIAMIERYWRQGGGAAPFTPASLGSKLKGWYEADGLVAGSTTVNGITAANGDVSQLSDLSGNSNHFLLGSANAPNFDGTKINFVSGSSEGFISTALFSAISSDVQGEMVIVFTKTTGANTFPIAMSRAADTAKRSVFGIIDASDKIYAQFKQSDSASTILTGTKVFSDTQFITLSISSNNSTYKLFYEINGERIEDTIVISGAGSPTNDGDWIDWVAPSNISLFNTVDSSPIYYSGSLYAFLYCNEQLTSQERSDLFCYLNDNYQVWP